ncbi:MAG: U32 family peptidase [Lachnospiraceae bacterium]|nr:U32 family peptidase [Lachnospiraceae bacterium]
MKKKVELLAPAGNLAAFYGAIHAGADAVYLAGTKYGARAYADNFTQEDLVKCLRYAHLLRKKVYLTINTLVKEEELKELPSFLQPYVDEGLDGVIIQDFGVLKTIAKHFPGLSLHASTQMSVSGIYGAKLLKEMGVERIVPARELSLSEIRRIKQETGLEIECFIHGAMCYCYSGQCLFSSILGGRSGNRGRCAQPCRLPYQVSIGGRTGKECYPLSLKDMCTIELLPELIDAGIDSFKIEGRMKKAEYAAGVTSYYRKYIDLYEKGEPAKPSKKDLEELSHLYIRSERTDGYYHRRNGKEMVTISSPAYQTSDEQLLSKIETTYLSNIQKIPIFMKAEFLIGEPAKLTISLPEKQTKQSLSLTEKQTTCAISLTEKEKAPAQEITVYGEIVSPAQKAPITIENVRKQLQKLGDSSFTLTDQEGKEIEPKILLEDGAFYPLKLINELRREAVSRLEEVMLHGK